MSPNYPKESLQFYCDPWWVRAGDQQLRRGCLLWSVLPHVDQHPNVLIVKGRSEATEHRFADFEIQALQGNRLPAGSDLPVAGLPHYAGEARLVYRAKKRPALVISTGGTDVPKSLRTGSARYQTNTTMLVAPYYGADLGGKTGGWRPEFVERIRRCEYPQYMWDSLPLGGREESILRLDHIQPLGRHGESYELTEYVLGEEAMLLLDDYLDWLIQGEIPAGSVLRDVRTALLGLG